MNSSQKGAVSELKAAAWLIDQGYEVFRNLVPTGPADLVAFHPETGEFIAVDVKTLSIQTNSNGWETAARRKHENPHVRILYVHKNSVGWEPEDLPSYHAFVLGRNTKSVAKLVA
jgi:Holliday junction resolvase-like predicted endonuclease